MRADDAVFSIDTNFKVLIHEKLLSLFKPELLMLLYHCWRIQNFYISLEIL